MFIFNQNYRTALTVQEKRQISRMKRAADYVYRYYEWLARDYRRQDHPEHETQILELRQDVKVRLYLNDDQDPLVNYFIACAMFGIMNHNSDEYHGTTIAPVDRQRIELMYDHVKVAELLKDAPYELVSLVTGCFFGSKDKVQATDGIVDEMARNGTLVQADIELIQTVNMDQLIAEARDDEVVEEDEAAEIFLQRLFAEDESSMEEFQMVSDKLTAA